MREIHLLGQKIDWRSPRLLVNPLVPMIPLLTSHRFLTLVCTEATPCNQTGVLSTNRSHQKLHLATHPLDLKKTTDTRLHIVQTRMLILSALTIPTRDTCTPHHTPSPGTIGLTASYLPLANPERLCWAGIPVSTLVEVSLHLDLSLRGDCLEVSLQQYHLDLCLREVYLEVVLHAALEELLL